MEEFVAYIVKNLVASPEAVEIRSTSDNDSVKLEIRVAQEDVGKVIGRRGSTIHALRTIVRRISSRVRKKVEIDLIQPENQSVASLEDEEFSSSCCSFEGGCCQEAAEEVIEEPQLQHSCGCHSESL
ncbi:KH domain-containing protein [Chlamydiifrater volucris]|uniref:KH domain-containing protein n=1 Tax=Chlamydiifrater volucris TaxID=2681470 RepID=UPI001BCCC657|nr:KH domain-containing protein [Chlamydiifrater volucris]